MEKLDQDTAALFTEAEHVANMLQSEGWQAIKAKLDQRILDLQNINNLDLEKPATLSIQLAARKMAVDEIWAWIKNDVYGFVEQQERNKAAMTQPPQNEYIGRD